MKLLKLCLLAGPLTAAILLSSSCASNAKPASESMLAAELAISSAERSRVSQYAAAELTQAREILKQAQLAMQQKNMPNAERLAQQSLVNTQLAVARAELIKAEQVNAEMDQGIFQLQQEIQRNQGVK
ncbi:MAG: DUF4398 domain-containing protein [Paraglaciecola sp.]|nr:DUF4398 domain-containing protein [Paraglaciecola sp.]